MRKFAAFMIFIILISLSTPVMAQPYLVSLSINEEIVPGPDSTYLTVSGTYSDGTRKLIQEYVVWTSSNTNIAKMSSNGRLEFTGKGGSVTISVYKEGIYGYKTINVKPWPKSLDIETHLIYSDSPYRLMVKGNFSDGETRYFSIEDGIQWSTSNPWVAWVNSQGVVTFTGEEGYVSIKAIHGKLEDSVNVTVSGGSDQTVFRKGIKIKEEIKYSLTPQKLTLVAIMTDDTEEEIANSSADWSSSDTSVATINSEGEIRFTGKPGFTRIKVVYGGYTYEKVVTVGRFLEKLLINQSLNYTTAWEGTPLNLSVTGYYNDGSEVIMSTGINWTVDNKKVASISPGGLLNFSGQAGRVTIKAAAPGEGESIKEDAITVEVPAADKPTPLRLLIDMNPMIGRASFTPLISALYSDGILRDVTKAAQLTSATPETASVFQGQIFISPNPGPIRVAASFQNLRDEITGFVPNLPGNPERIMQIRIKEHSLSYSHQSQKISGQALMGDGTLRDVTASLKWRSSQPLVVGVNSGVVVFKGRTGKAVISAEGYGFRDQLTVEVTAPELLPHVEKLTIEGELTRGANQLRAKARFNDGTVRDVTTETVWNTSNRNVAVITSQGEVLFPQGIKPVTISAHYQGKEDSIVP